MMSRRLTELPEDAPRSGEHTAVTAVVALGTNLGDRRAMLDAAVAELHRLPLTEDVRVADPIESVAVTQDGPDENAPAYLNSVALLRTQLAPSVLLGLLHTIEARHGRVRRERWGDRTLDLDLIAYGDLISDDPHLLVPHPRAAERDFVLQPWLLLDADAVVPGVGRVDELLARLRGHE